MTTDRAAGEHDHIEVGSENRAQDSGAGTRRASYGLPGDIMASCHSALLVDDDPMVTGALREALAGHPVEIAVALDAHEAIARLDSGRFCGLILNLGVARRGSGVDVLRHMSERRLELPTVVITPKLPDDVRELAVIDQIKLVLPKPVEPSLLAAAVLGLCGIERTD
jgi:DNA-binding NarL/FixJ family response regulator